MVSKLKQLLSQFIKKTDKKEETLKMDVQTEKDGNTALFEAETPRSYYIHNIGPGAWQGGSGSWLIPAFSLGNIEKMILGCDVEIKSDFS